MRGKVLTYADLEGTGIISGDDANRYSFTRGDLQGGARTVYAGAEVDFQPAEDKATNIYLVAGAADMGGKNKVAAALLAFFLGWLGIHKFYLGKTTAGVIMLVGGTIGWITFGLVPAIVGLIAFIEFIIYLTKSDQQFYQDYVVGNKSWF